MTQLEACLNSIGRSFIAIFIVGIVLAGSAHGQTRPFFTLAPGVTPGPSPEFSSLKDAADYAFEFQYPYYSNMYGPVDPENPFAVAAGNSLIVTGPRQISETPDFGDGWPPRYIFTVPARMFYKCDRTWVWLSQSNCENYFNMVGYYTDIGLGGAIRAFCELFGPYGTVNAVPPLETVCPGKIVEVYRDIKPKPKTCEAGGPPDTFGNPLEPLRGTKRELVETGLRVGGQPLRLTYDSSRKLVTAADFKQARDFGDQPSFGAMWVGSLHKSLFVDPTSTNYKVYRGDGSATSFWKNGATFVSDGDVNDALVSISGGYIFISARTKIQESYNSAGQLISSVDSLGNTLTYAYSSAAGPAAPGAGYLMSVTDNNGRNITFEYAPKAGLDASRYGRISKITDNSGRTIVPTYDSNENLTSLTWSDGKVRSFVYENSTFPWALTGVVDELGNRFSTFSYDNNGLAISSEHAGGVNKFTVSYQTPPAAVVRKVVDVPNQTITRYHEWQAPMGVAVTNPAGVSISLSSTDVFGRPKMAGLSQAAGSGCQASNSAANLDANGNVISSNDFSGNRTCFAYDSKNREILRVEGLISSTDCTAITPVNATLPLGARRTTTQWHPDWQQPTKITAPGSIATIVYHGQPDPFNGDAPANCTNAPSMPDGKPLPLVCKKVLRATLSNGAIDSSVSAKTFSYVYDSGGRILSTTDSLNYTISYTYFSETSFTGVAPNSVGHTVGDLKSVTYPGGFVTTYDLYDTMGRVLKMTDVKGIVTDTSYTPRGWVKTVSTIAPGQTARVTTYDYDNAGQLTVVSQPDGSSVHYAYDAAHRLVGVTDAKGNSINYTLDNMGNRINEQIKDPSGVLQRTVSRSFDALNRVQQVTGGVE